MPRRRASIAGGLLGWRRLQSGNTVNVAPWQESLAAPLIAMALAASTSSDELAGMSQPALPLFAVVNDSELRLQPRMAGVDGEAVRALGRVERDAR